jgi:hypothetical protein
LCAALPFSTADRPTDQSVATVGFTFEQFNGALVQLSFQHIQNNFSNSINIPKTKLLKKNSNIRPHAARQQPATVSTALL